MSYWTTGKGSWSESTWNQSGVEEIRITSELTAHVVKEFKIPGDLLFNGPRPAKPWRIVMRHDGEPIFHSDEVRDQFLGKGSTMFNDLPLLIETFAKLHKELLTAKRSFIDGYTETGKRDIGSEFRHAALYSISKAAEIVRKISVPITNNSATIGQVRNLLYTVNSEPLKDFGVPAGTVRITNFSVGSVELEFSLFGFTENSYGMPRLADHNILFDSTVTTNDYNAKSNAVATEGEKHGGYHSIAGNLFLNKTDITWSVSADPENPSGVCKTPHHNVADPFSKQWGDTTEKVDETLKGRQSAEARNQEWNESYAKGVVPKDIAEKIMEMAQEEPEEKKINFREFT